jgi:hypothetical protein
MREVRRSVPAESKLDPPVGEPLLRIVLWQQRVSGHASTYDQDAPAPWDEKSAPNAFTAFHVADV